MPAVIFSGIPRFWKKLLFSDSLLDNHLHPEAVSKTANLKLMIKYGSMAYGLFFIVSFPMVSRLDEDPEDNWTVGRTVINAFAATAIVLYIMDFWTKLIGRIY